MIIFVLAFLLGIYSCSPTTRIVHGTPSTIEDHPSVIQVNQFDPGASFWFYRCGGNILSQNVILTSAICFGYDDVNIYRIRAGTTYRNRGGVLAYFASILIHPSYDDPSSADFADLALVHLRDPLTFGDTINFISIIPQGWEIPDNSPGTYAAWGLTHEEIGTANLTEWLEIPLQTLDVNIISHERCQQRVEDAELSHDVLCAGTDNERGVYAGDNGGPLYYGGVLAGLIAGMLNCSDPYPPSANLKIAAHTNWIVDNA